MRINNETIGISAEVAIADHFNVFVDELYRSRSNEQIVDSLGPVVKEAFNSEDIPTPLELIARDQNPVDFALAGGKTLSVKTNQRLQGKVAPQNVGQPTSDTYFNYFNHLYEDFVIPVEYHERAQLFKNVTIDKIDEVMSMYWDNLFDCDYLIHFYNFLNSNRELTNYPLYKVYHHSLGQKFLKDKFTFTQTKTSWNESNTVKYNNISMGEFQVHKNRNCFKFRFNMKGINKLIESGELY